MVLTGNPNVFLATGKYENIPQRLFNTLYVFEGMGILSAALLRQ